jgi:hypothetical protein
MNQNPKSEGKCLFCDKTFAKAEINRHLKTHLKTHLKQKATESPKGKSYFVNVETDSLYGSTPYFLSLWVNGTATMQDIDDFLRDIWLECCGHMSAFTDPANVSQGDVFDAMKLLEQGEHEAYEKLMEAIDGEIPMDKKVNKFFHKGLKLKYEYDFGSSTNLQLTVIAEYLVKADKKITLLSRNEPLEWLCHSCQKEPATQICIVHGWDDDSMFCEKCAKKHAKKCSDFEDYAAIPVVNSPRMGVCAYEGGTIDVARDGAFVKK